MTLQCPTANQIRRAKVDCRSPLALRVSSHYKNRHQIRRPHQKNEKKDERKGTKPSHQSRETKAPERTGPPSVSRSCCRFWFSRSLKVFTVAVAATCRSLSSENDINQTQYPKIRNSSWNSKRWEEIWRYFADTALRGAGSGPLDLRPHTEENAIGEEKGEGQPIER